MITKEVDIILRSFHLLINCIHQRKLHTLLRSWILSIRAKLHTLCSRFASPLSLMLNIAIGTYNDQENATSCERCPTGMISIWV